MADKILMHVESAAEASSHDAAEADSQKAARAEGPAAQKPQASPKVAVAPAVSAAEDGASGREAAAAASAGASPSGTETAQDGAGTAPGDASHASLARFTAWMHQTFPNSTHAVIGGICGLAVAIMLFTIGLLKTLVVAIFVIAGVAVGQYVDGDPKIVRIVQELMRRQ